MTLFLLCNGSWTIFGVFCVCACVSVFLSKAGVGILAAE